MSAIFNRFPRKIKTPINILLILLISYLNNQKRKQAGSFGLTRSTDSFLISSKDIVEAMVSEEEEEEAEEEEEEA